MRKYPSIIKFVLDDAIHEVDFLNTGFKPTTTVLNYLRSLPNHKGVKEGCAEGDCGACTIVVASLNNRGALEYKSVASCLVFLPMVHGKQLITVENLAQKKDFDSLKDVYADNPKGWVVVDGLSRSRLPEGYIDFLDNNLEMVKDVSTFGNFGRITLYSWDNKSI